MPLCKRCGGATVGSRSPTPTALEKLRCVFSVTRKHPWRTPRGLIRIGGWGVDTLHERVGAGRRPVAHSIAKVGSWYTLEI